MDRNPAKMSETSGESLFAILAARWKTPAVTGPVTNMAHASIPAIQTPAAVLLWTSAKPPKGASAAAANQMKLATAASPRLS